MHKPLNLREGSIDGHQTVEFQWERKPIVFTVKDDTIEMNPGRYVEIDEFDGERIRINALEEFDCVIY